MESGRKWKGWKNLGLLKKGIEGGACGREWKGG